MKMNRLENKNIYYIITGAPKAKYATNIIKEMISEGARVFTIPTKASLDFIDLDKLKEIKKNTIKTDWDEKKKLPKEDAVLIAPCTFNTFNAIVAGSSVSYVLCIIASAIGQKIPVYIAPAMNKSLWDHPIVQENIKKLESWGCHIIWPEISHEKVAMVDVGKILDTLYFSFKRVNYAGKKNNRRNLLKKLNDYRGKYFDEFIKIGNFLKKNNLNLYSAGCMSIKVDNGFLITSTGSDMAELKKENISWVYKWNEEKKIFEWCGNFLPSSETPLHCIIHETKKYHLVLHVHCPKITYSDNLKRYQSERYLRYGTFEIGHKAKVMVSKNKFFIMKCHGEIIVGNSTDELKELLLKYYKKS